VTSVAGAGSEVVGLAVFGGFAVASGWLDIPAAVAVSAVPLLTLAVLTRAWLPVHRPTEAGPAEPAGDP